MKGSIGYVTGSKDSRARVLADVEKVYGPEFAAVVVRFLDDETTKPCDAEHAKQLEQEQRTRRRNARQMGAVRDGWIAVDMGGVRR